MIQTKLSIGSSVLTNYVILFLFLFTSIIYAQKEEYPFVFDTDTTWGKEIFPFPIKFAPEIDWEGYEEAQFTKGWGKQDSPEFWTYIFGWNIEQSVTLSKEELKSRLQLYFDGLMKGVNKDKDKVLPPTDVNLLGDGLFYTGQVKVYDSFRTKDVIILNLLVDIHACENEEKTIIVFRFSPQEFKHEIWTRLKSVGLHNDVCGS